MFCILYKLLEKRNNEKLPTLFVGLITKLDKEGKILDNPLNNIEGKFK